MVDSEFHAMPLSWWRGREIHQGATIAEAIPVRDAQFQMWFVPRQDGVVRMCSVCRSKLISKTLDIARLEKHAGNPDTGT